TIYIERPLVNLLGGIQPDLVSRIAGDRGNDGLADRFVFVKMRPTEEFFDTPDTPVHLEAAWQGAARKLYMMRGVPRELTLDDLARQTASRAYNAHYREKAWVRDHAPWRLGFWSKAEALASRLALVLACLRYAAEEREDEAILASDVEDAWRLVDWAKNQHVAVAGDA